MPRTVFGAMTNSGTLIYILVPAYNHEDLYRVNHLILQLCLVSLVDTPHHPRGNNRHPRYPACALFSFRTNYVLYDQHPWSNVRPDDDEHISTWVGPERIFSIVRSSDSRDYIICDIGILSGKSKDRSLWLPCHGATVERSCYVHIISKSIYVSRSNDDNNENTNYR